MTAFEFPRARLARIKDGDSVVLEIDVGFRSRTEVDCRLYGIDTPEIFRGNPIEKAAGQVAKLFVISWMAEASIQAADNPEWPLSVRLPSQSKYGDWLARVSRTDGRELNRDLLTEGLARFYFGRKKQPWKLDTLERIIQDAGDRSR